MRHNLVFLASPNKYIYSWPRSLKAMSRGCFVASVTPGKRWYHFIFLIRIIFHKISFWEKSEFKWNIPAFSQIVYFNLPLNLKEGCSFKNQHQERHVSPRRYGKGALFVSLGSPSVKWLRVGLQRWGYRSVRFCGVARHVNFGFWPPKFGSWPNLRTGHLWPE